jgi:Arc/MetJ family transcription regulator
MKRFTFAFFFIVLLLVLDARAQVTSGFFGNHLGGPTEQNIDGRGQKAVWPTSKPGIVRLWDTWGQNPTQGKVTHLFWRDINIANDTYDWTVFDKVLDTCKNRGVDVLYTFGYVPSWANGGNNQGTPPTDTAYFGKFVRAIANRAIQRGWPIKYWEIWNEPEEGSYFWNGTWAQLANMGRCAYQTLKAIDPSYTVLTPPTQGRGAAYWMEFYLKAGGWQWCDAVSYHGYINFYIDNLGERFEGLIDRMNALKTQYNIASKPLWDTEGVDMFTCGSTTCYDLPGQAAYLAQRFLISAAKGVKRVFWYGWDMFYGKQWGNETGTFKANEIGIANEKVVEWMLGATVTNLVVSNGVYSVDITKNGVTNKAVWVNAGTASYTTTYTQYETLAGSTGTVNGSITIGRKPTLLKGTVTLVAPSVSLTSPLANASVSAPANMTLAASAQDSDGSISKVEFYSGTTLVGTATQAPYSVTWNNVPAGSYSLAAKATDNSGLSTTSAAVTITVKALVAPSVSLTSPLANASVSAPANMTLAASAQDSDGSISKVEFYSGTTLVGTATQAPYSVTWNNVPAGSYSLAAKATDNSGLSTTSAAVTITVKALVAPSVSLTSPLANASVSAPANMTLAASAQDSDGSISKVEFYSGTTLVGTATQAPYSVTWNNVPAGSYSLAAKATDNSGLSTTSAAVTITVKALVAPSVSLTSPLANASVSAPANMTLAASAQDSDGSISKVEFYSGTTLVGTATQAPYSVTWNNVPAGSYSLAAKATDNSGLSTTSAAVTITVKALVAPSVSLTSPLANASVSAPANMTLAASAQDSDGSISKVEFYSGTTLVGTATQAPYSVTWNNVPAGSYSLAAKATDNSGLSTTSAAVNVTVADQVEVAYYRDADGDGYGNDNSQVLAVSAPSGYVSRKGDCDDANANAHPSAVEICNNGIDDNCDGRTDDGCSTVTIADPTSSAVINDTTSDVYNGVAVFTIRLDKQSNKPVALSYKTVEGTAKNNLHYIPAQGILTIPAGSMFGTVKVNLLNPNLITKSTAPKNFYVQLTEPNNALIADNSGKATIYYKKSMTLIANTKTIISDQALSRHYNDEVENTVTTIAGVSRELTDFTDNGLNKGLVVNAFPNPTSGSFKLNIRGGSQQLVTVNIFEISGRLIERRTGVLPNSIFQYGQNLQKGVYLMHFSQGENKTTLRLVKL